MTYLFCNKLESVRHLFFEYCMAPVFWRDISEIIGLLPVASDFESVAKFCLIEKEFKVVNVCTSAV
jgi:hypothetical protein